MLPDLWKMKPMRRANRLEDEGIAMALECYCEDQVQLDFKQDRYRITKGKQIMELEQF